MKLKTSATMLLSLVLLTACSNETTSSSLSTSDVATTTTTTTATTTTRALQSVNPDTFLFNGGSYIMDYTLSGDKHGTCVFDEDEVTCTGEPAADVPDLGPESAPFTGRPGAVSISQEGYSYGVFEGVPPAPAALKAGQQMAYEQVTCAMPDESRLTCSVGETSFTIAGPDGLISTTGPARPLPEVTEAPQTSTPSADVESEAGSTCTGDTGEVIEVRKGRVSCKEALAVMGQYVAEAKQKGGGNSLFMTFGDWGCSSPTAAQSQQTGATNVCENPATGTTIAR